MAAYVALSLALLAACAAFASGQKIRVEGSCANPESCIRELKPGLDVNIRVSLDAPITCQNLTRVCQVAVLVTNLNKEAISVNPCALVWNQSNWYEDRYINVKAIEGFVFTGAEVFAHIQTEPVDSASNYYNRVNPNDVIFKTRSYPSAVCSSVGDPHYTTFDSRYWHFYDGRNGRRLVTMYKSLSPTRGNHNAFGDVIIQAAVRGDPAVNCAIGGREGNDWIILDVCSGRFTQTPRFVSPEGSPQRPRVTNVGSSYTVTFASGVYFRADVGGSWMNVYVGAPGRDFNAVCGMCGNFNGNPNDEVPLPGSRGDPSRGFGGHNTFIRDVNDLFPCQQVTEDMRNWQDVPFSPSVNISKVDVCDYVEPAYIPPILNNADGEDITEELRKAQEEAFKDRTKHFFNHTQGPPPNAGITRELARQHCETTYNNSNTIKICKQFYPNLPIFSDAQLANTFDDCTDDVFTLQTYEAAKDVIVTDTVQCAEHATEVGDQSNPEIQKVMCINACSGSGDCQQQTGADNVARPTCNCDPNFENDDCSHDVRLPAAIDYLYDIFCETTGLVDCPEELYVVGSNFFKNPNLMCRYTYPNGNTEDYAATFLGGDAVLCPIPDPSGFQGLNPTALQLTITNDDQAATPLFSNPATFTYYNARCQVCDETSKVCSANPTSCTINGACYLDKTHNHDNVCLFCNATASSSAWSVDWSNEDLCGPIFVSDFYTTTIAGRAEKDEVLIDTIAVGNALTDKQADWTVKYSLRNTHDIPGVKGCTDWFNINENTGVITAKDVIDIKDIAMDNNYAADDPHNFNGFCQVHAVGPLGSDHQATVIITLRRENHPNFFDQAFSATLPEDAALGTFVTKVEVNQATKDTKDITFSWWFDDNARYAFAIDPSTGVVTLNTTLNYNSKKKYTLQVQAQDAEQLVDITEVDIFVTDVPEAPTDITLNSTSFPEATMNPLVGRLGSVDAEGGSFTYTLLNSTDNFEIKLVNGMALLYGKGDAFDVDAVGAQTVYWVQIQTKDDTDRTFAKVFALTVTPVNEPPTNLRLVDPQNPSTVITSFPESLVRGEEIGTILATDPENYPYVCVITEVTPEDGFELTQNELLLNTPIKHIEYTTTSVTVLCVDRPPVNSGIFAASSSPETFNLAVEDADQGPHNISFTQSVEITENDQAGLPKAIGTLTAWDFDAPTDSLSFEVFVKSESGVAQPHASFEISQSTDSCSPTDSGKGVVCTASLTLKDALDYEGSVTNGVMGNLTVLVRVTDNENFWSEFPVYVTVKDAPDAPSDVVVDPLSVEEGVKSGDFIATVTAIDDDEGDTHTFELLSTGNGAVKLGAAARRSRRGSSQQLLVDDDTKFDYETNPSITFRIKVTDSSGRSLEKDVTMEIRDKPMTITSNQNTFPEDTVVGSQLVATLTLENFDNNIDTQGPTSFSLQPSNVYFELREISGNKLQRQLFLSKQVDFEALPAGKKVSAPVEIAFPGNWHDPIFQTLEFTVTDVDEAPVFTPSSLSLTIFSKVTPRQLAEVQVVDPEGQTVSTPTLSIPSGSPLAGKVSISTLSNNKFTISLSQAMEPVYKSTEQLTITATSGSKSTTFVVSVTLEDACADSPCFNGGTCRRCALAGAVNPGGPLANDCTDAQEELGYKCLCRSTFTGNQCEQGDVIYTINSTLELLLPPGSTMTNSQKTALINAFIDALSEEAENQNPPQTVNIRPNDVSVHLIPQENGFVKVVISRKSTIPPLTFEGDESNGIELTLNYRDGSDGSTKTETTQALNPTVTNTEAKASTSENSAAGVSGGVVAGIAVGIILLLILVVLLLLLLRKHNSHIEFDKDPENAIYSSHAINPTFQPPNKVVAGGNGNYSDIPASSFEVGVANPMYDWYQPEMSRQECTNYLTSLGEGAFVIRDSAATPGWHMLGIKTANEVVHEKIRYTEDGQYELLPSKTGNKKQPRFKDLPSLVEWYTSPQNDVPYTLAVSNPIYDNHQLGQTKTGYAQPAQLIINDPNAPMLPLKENEVDRVQELVHRNSVSTTDDDIYTNTNEAKVALKARSDYQKTPAANARDVGYLDIDPSL